MHPTPISRPALRVLLAAGALLLLSAAPAALAQDASSYDREAVRSMEPVEVARDGAALIDALRVRPEERDVADTALVFTSYSPHRQRVVCVAFNRNGRPVGKTATILPPHGVRYVLASDLADDLDFVGSAQCGTHSTVKGTAVFLGPGLTDLPVRQVRASGIGRMAFPLIATY